MVTYPGLPGPEIGDHLSWEDSHGRYAEGTEFQIGRISMVANTGTYVDAPAHRHRGGTDLAGLDLGHLANLPGVVVDVTGAAEPGIGALALAPYDVSDRAVLFRTGWDRHWRTDAYGSADAPYLTRSGTEWLVAHQAALVGIDSVNIDATADPQRPAHTAAGRRGPRAGAPNRPGPATRIRVPATRSAGTGARDGNLPRPRLRHPRATTVTPPGLPPKHTEPSHRTQACPEFARSCRHRVEGRRSRWRPTVVARQGRWGGLASAVSAASRSCRGEVAVRLDRILGLPECQALDVPEHSRRAAALLRTGGHMPVEQAARVPAPDGHRGRQPLLRASCSRGSTR